MNLSKVDTVDDIKIEDFQNKYYKTNKPLVIKNLAKSWEAYNKWNWEYFDKLVGDKKVALYNNTKSDAYTPINTADDYKTFGEYIAMIKNGPAAWRIFLFNIFDHAPSLMKDFTWPDYLMQGFVKKYPMLFTGGASSITHMHFDIDYSHILHTQFIGKKRVLLFPYHEKDKLYRKPFEVLSIVDFSHYSEEDKSKIDYKQFPALKHANGYEVILEHGDTLFMPAGYFHHMEYIESGFAMSLRAMQQSLIGKLQGVWNIIGMRTIDTMGKKIAPTSWYNWKVKKLTKMANNTLPQ